MTKVSVLKFRKLTLVFFLASCLLLGLFIPNSKVQAADTGNIRRDSYTKYLQVDTAQQTLPIYSSPTSTLVSGHLVATYSRWQVTGTYQGNLGKAFSTTAYDLGNNQWIKLSDATDSIRIVNLSGLPTANFFSDTTPYQLYSDPQTTKATGVLSSAYSLWQIPAYAYDKTGKYVAYDLGGDTWVKVTSPTQTVYFLNGLTYYNINAGVTTYNIYSQPTGTIQVSSVYGASEYRFDTNNQIMFKVGDDYQWVYGGDAQLNEFFK